MEQQASIRALLIPLPAGEHLLVPSAAAAEVTTHAVPVPMEDAPPWLLGMLAWRDNRVPVVYFEGIADPDIAPPSGDKVVVLYGLEGITGLGFYGLAAGGVPRAVQVGMETLTALQGPPAAPVLARVGVAGLEAMIPDLGRLERMLGERIGGEAQ